MSDAVSGIQAIALCLMVRDLEKTTRFYCEGLGFVPGKTVERGSEVAPNLELPDCKLRLRFLQRADARLELVELLEPLAQGDGRRRPGDSIGPFMWGFRCHDLRATADTLVRLGGTFVRQGKAGADQNYDLIMVTDPDGFRVELFSMPMALIEPLFTD
jgi:catechol 2,3-dioxygenase-like lactoylglutathione lyase family enzyme